MLTINIAEQFTRTPGGRLKSDGPFSGEEFREKFLEQHFAEGTGEEKIRIVLDGAYGYATSFLEEAFGGLARKFGSATVMKMLDFESLEEPNLPKEIIKYIEDTR